MSLLLAVLAGCVDAPADTPYILASGLGEAASVCVQVDGRLLVGTSTGAWAVGADGAVEREAEGPVTAVATQPAWRYTLGGGQLVARPTDGGPTRTLPAPGAVDLVAVAAAGEVWLLTADGIESVDVVSGARHPVASGLGDARGLTWAFDGRVLLWTRTGVSVVTADGLRTPLPGALQDARSVAGAADGTVYALDARGLVRLADPPVVLSERAAAATDLALAIGPRLPAGVLYGVTRDGRVDFWRPADLEGGDPRGAARTGSR